MSSSFWIENTFYPDLKNSKRFYKIQKGSYKNKDCNKTIHSWPSSTALTCLRLMSPSSHVKTNKCSFDCKSRNFDNMVKMCYLLLTALLTVVFLHGAHGSSWKFANPNVCDGNGNDGSACKSKVWYLSCISIFFEILYNYNYLNAL